MDRTLLRIASVSILIGVLAQQPGRIVAETKLDLTLAPGSFLHRAVGAWDPSAGFGRVQNQAAGYLFPMGPGSWLLQLLRCPPWLAQRLVVATLLLLGMRGAHRVAVAVGVATAPARVLAALAYVLSPATLTTVAFQSGGQIPYLVAPWVLVPLLTAGRRRGPRRAAAASTVAVAAMGGINGAATFAVLPLPLIWLATREPGSDRRRLTAWWLGGITAATLWWIVALGVTVRYGLRFTALTEQASTTTATTAALEGWRGTGNWLARLVVGGRPWLPGATALASSTPALLAGTAVAAAGAGGLARRDAPGRSWLLPSALLGACLMGIGYAGPMAGPLGGLARSLLDGPLVAFRNVHKFSPLVRLPLAIGFGHLVASGSTALAGASTAVTTRARPAAAPALALALLLATAAPGAGGLTAPGGFAALPGYWRRAATWLDHRPGTGRVLLLPGSAFGEYRWGRPLDEPLGSLLHRPWAVRDLIPVGGNGSTRLLDGIETALTADAPPPGLTETLYRAGIGHLLVRNDLDLTRTGAPAPSRVRAALERVPGLHRVAAFGPAIPSGRAEEPTATDAPGPTPTVRAIDIYRVGDRPPERVTLDALRDAVAVTGGPEGLLAVPARILAGRAAFVGRDADRLGVPHDLPLVATDTARRRDVGFGDVRDTAGPTLTATEPSPWTGTAPRDRWPDPDPPPLTTARVLGAASLGDTADHQARALPEHTAGAAFDGDPESWWAPPWPTAGHALVVGFARPRRLGRITVTAHDAPGARITGIAVRTDGGLRATTRRRNGRFALSAPAGSTRHLRVEITGVAGSASRRPPGIGEVHLGGTPIARTIVAAPGSRPADLVALTRLTRDRADPTRTDEEAVLDRTVSLARSRAWTFGGTASSIATARTRCGAGPALTVDGTPVPTRLLGPDRTSTATSTASRPWRACRPVALAAGEHRIVGGPVGASRITTLIGRSHGPGGRSPIPSPPHHRRATVTRWGAQARDVDIGAGEAAVLATTENQNAGWIARMDGHRLPAARVDGWRQAFLVPAGAGGRVSLRFEPDRAQGLGLRVGSVALLALLLAAVLPGTGRRPRRTGAAATPSAPPPRAVPGRAGLPVAGAVGLILGGPLALAAGPLRVRRGPGDRLSAITSALVLAAGIAATMTPAGPFSAAAQIPAVLAWVALAASW